jgi:hypothetical protein
VKMKTRNILVITVSEEDISKLTPDLLLYRASAAHNLSVMCHALALKANVNWINVEDHGRFCLHQAVVSVRISLLLLRRLVPGIYNLGKAPDYTKRVRELRMSRNLYEGS